MASTERIHRALQSTARVLRAARVQHQQMQMILHLAVRERTTELVGLHVERGILGMRMQLVVHRGRIAVITSIKRSNRVLHSTVCVGHAEIVAGRSGDGTATRKDMII
jgi:hypothetical protein